MRGYHIHIRFCGGIYVIVFQETHIRVFDVRHFYAGDGFVKYIGYECWIRDVIEGGYIQYDVGEQDDLDAPGWIYVVVGIEDLFVFCVVECIEVGGFKRNTKIDDDGSVVPVVQNDVVAF